MTEVEFRRTPLAFELEFGQFRYGWARDARIAGWPLSVYLYMLSSPPEETVTRELVMEDLGIGRDVFANACKRLTECGFLATERVRFPVGSVDKDGRPNGGQHSKTIYHLLDPATAVRVGPLEKPVIKAGTAYPSLDEGAVHGRFEASTAVPQTLQSPWYHAEFGRGDRGEGMARRVGVTPLSPSPMRGMEAAQTGQNPRAHADQARTAYPSLAKPSRVTPVPVDNWPISEESLVRAETANPSTVGPSPDRRFPSTGGPNPRIDADRARTESPSPVDPLVVSLEEEDLKESSSIREVSYEDGRIESDLAADAELATALRAIHPGLSLGDLRARVAAAGVDPAGIDLLRAAQDAFPASVRPVDVPAAYLAKCIRRAPERWAYQAPEVAKPPLHGARRTFAPPRRCAPDEHDFIGEHSRVCRICGDTDADGGRTSSHDRMVG